MGVPRLFKYINDNYPKYVKTYIDGTKPSVEVDNLLFDANALIYNALADIDQEDILPAYGGNAEKEPLDARIYRVFMDKVNRFVHMFPPKKLIYLAIDGCAPLGKQAQQRQRRYIAARESSGKGFDRCSITPGTKFMLNLTRYINTDIRRRMMYDKMWSRVKVMFSPPSVPGEGEHKLLSFIRKNYRTISKQKTYMYGPDGDLIMLGLATYCPEFYLIREDFLDKTKTTRIDIGSISKLIVKDLGEFTASSKSFTVSPRDIINDFILLGFFVGNDFLPKIQMFHLLEEGVDTMITDYKLLTKRERTTITREGNIDTKMMERFIMSLGHRENKLLQEQTNISLNREQDKRFLNITLLECTSNVFRDASEEGGTKQYRQLDFQRYRVNYYSKKLGIERDGISHREYSGRIDALCKEYMDGLYWVFKYYIEGCPSMRWYYPRYYAPLFVDFINVFRRGWTPPIFYEEDKIPSTPFQQLLTVLPSQSKYLLPREYAEIMTDDSADFDIDYEGKLKEYQGIAILPFVDFEALNKRYQDVIPRYNYTRNRLGKIFVFKHNGSRDNITYTSKYGTIYECKIDVQRINVQ